jgi:serine/threonine protein kinase
MGVVYKATDPRLGRLVAIKMMTGGFADDPELLKRFYREAQSTANLNHPNIVTVYDMGDQDGTPYLVMQFLEGESLQAIIKSRRELSLLTKTNYLLQVCHGLQHAHEQEITHRDVKPGNIMVLPDGKVKIVDFGVARIGSDRMTRPGQVMGSFSYMSPEQIDDREVDARSDIFALGIVMYEFFAYAPPFQGRDMSSILLKILYDPAPPLSSYLGEYPAGFDAILERALAKKRADRYQSVDEMRFDLAEVELQLRKETVANLFEESERLISEGSWVKARERLQRLVKLDPQNAKASQRLRQVQVEIQKQDAALGATLDVTLKDLEQDVPPTQEAGYRSHLDEAGNQVAGREFSFERAAFDRAALRAKQLRDQGILELTPPDGMIQPAGRVGEPTISNDMSSSTLEAGGSDLTSLTPPGGESGASSSLGSRALSESGSRADISGWPDETLKVVEKQLASFIGSLSRIVVRKAAGQTTDVEKLYAILAAGLESQADREAFLARKGEVSKSWTKSSLTGETARDGSGSAASMTGSRAELTTAAIDHAGHLLARHIGPIAGVLAKRGAQRADSLRGLYLLLSEQVTDKAERKRFLEDAGFSEKPAA